MSNTWSPATYQIKLVGAETWDAELDGYIVEEKTQEVSGISNGLLAIDYRDPECHWVLNHLPTGWACFQFHSLDGAKKFGDRLTEKYGLQLSNIKTDGFVVEDFREVYLAVKADAELRELWKAYGKQLSPDQRSHRDEMSIIS